MPHVPLPASHTFTLTETQGTSLRALLERLNFEFSELPYAHFSARKGKCSVAHYLSGKTVIQGKEAREFIEFHFEPEITQQAVLGYEEELNPENYQPHIGVDEAGKGDFFGPLVIAGVFVRPHSARELIRAGVRDSKRVGSDRAVRELADRVKELTPNAHSIIAIGPKRYNELYSRMGNLNRLLAWGHGQVISNLVSLHPDCPRALSDQFAHPSLIERELKRKNITLQLDQRTKAESDTAVAAASILARDAFVTQLTALGGDSPLPKGASAHVKTRAIEILRHQGLEALAPLCKNHFKTFTEVQKEA